MSSCNFSLQITCVNKRSSFRVVSYGTYLAESYVQMARYVKVINTLSLLKLKYWIFILIFF